MLSLDGKPLKSNTPTSRDTEGRRVTQPCPHTRTAKTRMAPNEPVDERRQISTTVAKGAPARAATIAAPSVLARPRTMRRPRRTALAVSSSRGSNVQSQRDASTHSDTLTRRRQEMSSLRNCRCVGRPHHSAATWVKHRKCTSDAAGRGMARRRLNSNARRI